MSMSTSDDHCLALKDGIHGAPPDDPADLSPEMGAGWSVASPARTAAAPHR